MVEMEDIVNAESEEELKELKQFLFHESVRLAQEKRNLEDEKARLVQLQDDFMKDRVKLRDELDELNMRTHNERKKLKEENLFFDKKMEILKEGFRSLESDRKKFEEEKNAFLRQKKNQPVSDVSDLSKVAEYLFGNIGNNPLGLRKRYKDLMRIFHPDNLFGDSELCQAINKEYQRRKDKI